MVGYGGAHGRRVAMLAWLGDAAGAALVAAGLALVLGALAGLAGPGQAAARQTPQPGARFDRPDSRPLRD